MRRSVHVTLVIAVFTAMSYPGIQNLRDQHAIVGEYSNYPLEELLEWTMKKTPKGVFKTTSI